MGPRSAIPTQPVEPGGPGTFPVCATLTLRLMVAVGAVQGGVGSWPTGASKLE